VKVPTCSQNRDSVLDLGSLEQLNLIFSRVERALLGIFRTKQPSRRFRSLFRRLDFLITGINPRSKPCNISVIDRVMTITAAYLQCFEVGLLVLSTL
jgi:hypothetical protein